MSKKIASARISAESSALLKELNDSLPFDKALYREDIRGSLAHARMLKEQGIISAEDYEAIEKGLRQVLEEIESGAFSLDGGDEDIHMAVERRLTEIVGDAGKRLHTARSRNDQVAVDFRMYVLRHDLQIAALLRKLITTLLERAEEHAETLLPGMTHLQHAQPTNLGYHLMAYASMFRRDLERFLDSYERNNLSPLGCAALAGTPHPVDRQMTAKELGFRAPTLNCLDSVSDRDFALEILFNIATMMMHISRLSEELILWSTSEFGFVRLSDKHATGSSIMPQKKNPDIPELLRGKTGRAYGNLVSLLTVMKGLPLAYNKDTQEDKEGVFDSVHTAELSLRVLREMIDEMSVDREAMERACMRGHLTATDLADWLVREAGLPFRDAYHIVGNVVNRAEELGKDISQMTPEELAEVDARIAPEACTLLDNRASMNARASEGGTATVRTREQIGQMREWLEGLELRP
ncbi:argininosuccinate lyase [Nitratifractor salsuginis]|uniref:Argininosuccinate lyase n=1 Tax=Nitratifractor salsuginis (strain DSM 16511 / JCM 12458 / E9I37-1) TaxID=749222 RepID=E6WZK5_NITSE|nr:argininosuccinate lyase [Nitratifractor salsuginis]ADV45585.1 argininosuccinate lyase [Nitratifractor salsuginis DSM 16511]